MAKRVIIAHEWEGHPQDGWIPWFKAQLEADGLTVIVPQLPNPDEPRMAAWVPALAAAVGQPDTDTFLVGHSMGNQAIARYLATLPADAHVGGVVFVAGYFKRLTNLEPDAEVQAIAKEWLETPLDLRVVRSHIGKSIAIFSNNDTYVPLDNVDDFRDKLGSEIVTTHDPHAKGHFSTTPGGPAEVPVVLEAIRKIAGA